MSEISQRSEISLDTGSNPNLTKFTVVRVQSNAHLCWVGGFGFGSDIGAHNFKFSDADWIWCLSKNFGSNPIEKFPYPYSPEVAIDLECRSRLRRILFFSVGPGVKRPLRNFWPVRKLLTFCEISDLLLFVRYFSSQNKEIKFGNCFLMCVV